ERNAEAQLAATRARAEHEGLARRVADLARALEELELESARAARLAGEHAGAAETLDRQCGELAQESARKLEERGQAEVRLSELRQRAEEGRSSAHTLR